MRFLIASTSKGRKAQWFEISKWNLTDQRCYVMKVKERRYISLVAAYFIDFSVNDKWWEGNVREIYLLKHFDVFKITQKNDGTNTGVSLLVGVSVMSLVFRRGCNFALLPFHHLHHHRHQKNLQRLERKYKLMAETNEEWVVKNKLEYEPSLPLLCLCLNCLMMNQIMEESTLSMSSLSAACLWSIFLSRTFVQIRCLIPFIVWGHWYDEGSQILTLSSRPDVAKKGHVGWLSRQFTCKWRK